MYDHLHRVAVVRSDRQRGRRRVAPERRRVGQQFYASGARAVCVLHGCGAGPARAAVLDRGGDGVPVCDQDGQCLAVLPLPKEAQGLTPRSQAVLAAGHIVFALHARDGWRSMLCRVDTSAAEAGQLVVHKVAEGAGHWAVSPTLTADGRAVIGIGTRGSESTAWRRWMPRANSGGRFVRSAAGGDGTVAAFDPGRTGWVVRHCAFGRRERARPLLAARPAAGRLVRRADRRWLPVPVQLLGRAEPDRLGWQAGARRVRLAAGRDPHAGPAGPLGRPLLLRRTRRRLRGPLGRHDVRLPPPHRRRSGSTIWPTTASSWRHRLAGGGERRRAAPVAAAQVAAGRGDSAGPRAAARPPGDQPATGGQ